MEVNRDKSKPGVSIHKSYIATDTVVPQAILHCADLHLDQDLSPFPLQRHA